MILTNAFVKQDSLGEIVKQILIIVLQVHVQMVERVLMELMTSLALVQLDFKGRPVYLVATPTMDGKILLTIVTSISKIQKLGKTLKRTATH